MRFTDNFNATSSLFMYIYNSFTIYMSLKTYLLLLITFTSFAQTTSFEEINTSDGLSHPYVYQIYQTKDGFIWASTNNGLNRYDGYNFSIFRHSETNSFSLSEDRTKAILEDRKGRLWVTTNGKGLNLIDRTNNLVYHSKIISPKHSADNNITVWRLLEDSQGNIWMGGSMSTIFKMNTPSNWRNNYPENVDFTKELKLTPIELKEEIKDIKHLVIDGDILWAGSSNGRLFSYHTISGEVKEYQIPTQSGLGDPSAITGLFLHSSGHLIISTMSEGVYQLANGQVSPLLRMTTDFYYWLDDKGYVWMKNPEHKVYRVFWQNLNAFNPQINEYLFISKSRSYKTFLNLKDQVIFIGDVRGIKKVSIHQKPFKHFLTETDNYGVFKAKNGRILVKNNNIFSEADEKLLGKKAVANEFKNGTILQAKNGTIWVVASKDPMTLLKYDENFKFIKEYPIPNYDITHLPIISEDKNGTIWIAAAQAKLHTFEPDNEQFRYFSYQHLIQQTNHLHIGESFGIIESKNGSIWIVMEDALIEATKKGNDLVFKNYDASNSAFKGNTIQMAFEDPFEPDFLWVSTKEVGLQKWRKYGEVQHTLTLKNGLPDLLIMGALEDEKHNFWISSTKGLYRFNPKSLEIEVFGKQDGVQGEVFNLKTAYKSLNGEMLFSGNNGVNIFHPSQIKVNNDEPKPKISGIEINNIQQFPNNGTGILDKNIEQSESITLDYANNSIKLFFSLFDYLGTEKNQFKYQLEGVDREIVDAGKQNFASYVSLSPGTYIFKLYGSFSTGKWNKKPIELKITILPPWYRTWWAYLIYFSIVSYVALRFYQFQINKVKLSQELTFNQKEKERLAELDQLKTNFFANISHEFRTPLTLILAPIEDLITKNHSPKRQSLASTHQSGLGFEQIRRKRNASQYFKS
jgi:ligand-binding sensor domain-containing protein